MIKWYFNDNFVDNGKIIAKKNADNALSRNAIFNMEQKTNIICIIYDNMVPPI